MLVSILVLKYFGESRRRNFLCSIVLQISIVILSPLVSQSLQESPLSLFQDL